jgi:hypothetical protein
VHQKLLVSKYTATKWLLHSCIFAVLNIYTSNEVIVGIETGKIPLYKVRDSGRVLYISGIALWLSKSQNSTAMEIAQGIVVHLLSTYGSLFSSQIVSPGWIHLELTHPTLATWLQSLAVKTTILEPVPYSKFTPKENPGRLFAIQYAHARCYSLVLLAHREGLIQLKEPVVDSNSAIGDFLLPKSIPWLNCDQKLCLTHPAEFHLIHELLQVVDDWEISDRSSIRWEKSALSLSQAFETFWRNCRIWGEVNNNSPDLAQARLGLLMATQVILMSLLEEKLEVFAPLEL